MTTGEGQETPLSSLQKQFWLLQRAIPDGAAYHVCALFHIEGSLDADALGKALRDVVARHAALRTTFVEGPAGLAGRVRDDVPPELEVETTAIAPDDDAVRAELARPFDLTRGPLVRMRLWPCAGGGRLLAWTMHHAVCDLATKERLARELSERYAAHAAHAPSARSAGGAPSWAPAGGAEYAELARWEAGYLAGEAAKKDEEYFAEHLGTGGSVLTLPEDFRRPKLQSARGACVHFDLPDEVAHGIATLSKDLTTKPFLVLLTAYAALLGRYANQERVVVGVPFTNRRRAESHDAVGCFVNDLPLAVDLSGAPTFPELLRRVRASMLGHHRHQELPLERTIARLRPKRDPGRNPLFQTGFTFEPPPTLELEGARVKSLDAHAGGAQLDVFLTLWETAEGFRGRLEYCRDLFARETAERMVRCYVRLLESVVAPHLREEPALCLPMLTEADLRVVTLELNQTDRRYDLPDTLVEAFRRQVARTPLALAVRFGARSFTFAELAGRANALARRLREAGVPRGGRVALFMERSLEMVTAVWGVLLAGAAYVPIDPEFPAARVGHVLEDAAPACVLTHASVAGRFTAQAHVPVVVLDVDSLDPSAASVDTGIGPDDAAYIIFTSGSTGRPKGVVNTHRGITNRLHWMDEAYRLTPEDLVLQKTPYTFDVSTWELFWPTIVGAPLEVAPPGAHKDPAELASLIQRTRVTTVHFVPSMLHAFLAHPAAAACTSLTRIVCSGEALGAALVQRCAALLSAGIYNLYGPTEAAVDVTEWRCKDDLARDPVPIGKPIANTRLYILDPAGNPAPRGVLGELYIGGVQVALGYVNRPELTAERFLRDPFSKDPTARLYRTGDLARWAPDGNMLYEGRIDHQVKVRGNRIELGEIESVLEQHPAVLQSVVGVRHVGEADAQLVGYVVPKAGAPEESALVAAVRGFLAERLPAVMVPQHFMVLASMPLTSSGKVDRKLLPEPSFAAASSEATVPPRDEVEAWLVLQLGELLGGTRFGVHQNLFEIGATSLMCAELIGRVRAHLGKDVPLARIFEHPTVAGLASHLATIAAPGAAAVPAKSEELERARERAARQRGAAAARAKPPKR